MVLAICSSSAVLLCGFSYLNQWGGGRVLDVLLFVFSRVIGEVRWRGCHGWEYFVIIALGIGEFKWMKMGTCFARLESGS